MPAEEPDCVNGPPIRPPNREWLEEKLGFPLEEHALRKFLAEKKKEREEQALVAAAPSSNATTPERIGRKLMEVREQLPLSSGLREPSAEDTLVDGVGLAQAVLPADIASQPIFPEEGDGGSDDSQTSGVPPLTARSNDLPNEGVAEKKLETPKKINSAGLIEIPSPTTEAA